MNEKDQLRDNSLDEIGAKPKARVSIIKFHEETSQLLVHVDSEAPDLPDTSGFGEYGHEEEIVHEMSSSSNLFANIRRTAEVVIAAFTPQRSTT